MKKLVLLSTIAALPSLWTARARACSAPQCLPTVVAPRAGVTVTASVPGFPVLPARAFALSRMDAGAGVEPTFAELFDAAGRLAPTRRVEIAGSFEPAFLLVSTSPLVPGTYELRRPPDACSLASPSPEVTRFSVSASAPLPKSAGRVEIDAPERRRYRVNAGAACSDLADAVVRQLRVEPSAEMAGFLPIAKLEVRIDGERWGETVWGGTRRFEPVPEGSPIIFLPPRGTALHTICDLPSSPQRLDRGLSQGRHSGEVVVTIPNVGSLPPLPFQVDMDCAPNAPAPDAATVPIADPPPRDGCSYGGGGPGGVLLLSMVWLASRLRRQSRWRRL